MHLGDFAQNIGQLNHMIVYDETLRGGVYRHVLLTFKV